MNLAGCWTTQDHQIALVELTGRHRKLPYIVQRPCILLSSRTPVEDKSFVLPSVQEEEGSYKNKCMEMQGVLGAYVYDSDNTIAWRKVIRPELLHSEQSIPEPALSARDIKIASGKDKRPITQLNIFDFDGTLMSSPDEFIGKAEYVQSMGQPYPHLGWFGKQESLLPPIRVLPGPALRDYHSFFGRDGSRSVILTGRLERTRFAIEQVLKKYDIAYDEFICKTSGGDTWDFKISVTRRLLQTFKLVQKLRVWEDNVENLVKFYELRDSLKGKVEVEIYEAPNLSLSKLPSLDASFCWEERTHMVGIASFLEAMGRFPGNDYLMHAEKGVEFLVAIWKDVLQQQNASMEVLHMVTGDFAFGRRGTIDLWLKLPKIEAVDDVTLRFKQSLQENGITMHRQGERSYIRLQFSTFPPIHHAIRFVQTDGDAFGEHSTSDDTDGRCDNLEDFPPEVRTSMHIQRRWQRQTGDSNESCDAYRVACELLDGLCHAKVASKNGAAPNRYTLLMNLILSFAELHPDVHSLSADLFCCQLMKWLVKMSDDQFMEHVAEGSPAIGELDLLRGALDGLQRRMRFLLRRQESHEGRIEWTCLYDTFQRRR